MPHSGKSKRKPTPSTSSNGRPAKKARVDTVSFDLASRAAFLTGFHARKLARHSGKRNAAIKREKEERKELRDHARQMKKEKLDGMKREAREMYGEAEEILFEPASGDSSSSGSSDDEDDDDNPVASTSGTQHFDTGPLGPSVVSISSFSPTDRSPSPALLPPPSAASVAAAAAAAKEKREKKEPKKKKVKGFRGTTQFKPKMSKKEKKDLSTGKRSEKKKVKEGRR